jgi:hypothetical protein
MSINHFNLIANKIEEIYNKNKNTYSLYYDIVNEKEPYFVDYYNIIAVPMSLKVIIQRLKKNYYLNFDSILFDVLLILKNAYTFNDSRSSVAVNSKKLVEEIKIFIDYLKNNNPIIINNSLDESFTSSNNNNSNANSNGKRTGGRRMKKELENSNFILNNNINKEVIDNNISNNNIQNGRSLRRKKNVDYNESDKLLNNEYIIDLKESLDDGDEDEEENIDNNYDHDHHNKEYSLRRKRMRNSNNSGNNNIKINIK